MSTQERRLIELLQAKYRKDPKGLQEFLPGAVELLPEVAHRQRAARSPFGLTEHEVDFHRRGLSEAMDTLAHGGISAAEAAKALQHCANLIRDDNLDVAIGYEVIKGLVTAAIGKSPGSYKTNTTVLTAQGRADTIVEQVSAIRGVHLDLDREGRLISVSVSPKKMAERRRIMKFVGSGWDPNPDVAARHDDYLAMQDPNGRA